MHYKYCIPYFNLFLFDIHDLKMEIDPGSDPGDPRPDYTFIGYATTAERALPRLHSAGYTVQFFQEVLSPHLSDFDASYIELLAESAPSDMGEEKLVKRSQELERLDLSPSIRPRQGDLEQYLDFVRALIDGRRRAGLIRRFKTLGVPQNLLERTVLSTDGVPQVLGDLDELWGIPFDLSFYLPKGVVRVAHGISAISDDYGDFFDLFVAWLLVHSVSGTSPVTLDFCDLMDDPGDETEARAMLEDVRQDAVTKLETYNRAFGLLTQQDPALADQVSRSNVRQLLCTAIEERDIYRKGIALEEAVKALFLLSPCFKVISSRLNNEDEELDLVIQNNSSRPFLMTLQSTIMLVECKNWSSAVGSSELRAFESKVRNHSNLCRVGVFIATRGFARTANSFLRRLGRDIPVLALSSADEVLNFLQSDQIFEEWLEGQVAKALK